MLTICDINDEKASMPGCWPVVPVVVPVGVPVAGVVVVLEVTDVVLVASLVLVLGLPVEEGVGTVVVLVVVFVLLGAEPGVGGIDMPGIDMLQKQKYNKIFSVP